MRYLLKELFLRIFAQAWAGCISCFSFEKFRAFS